MPSWEIYSYFYSLSLRNLLPYKGLLEDLTSTLDIKEGDSILDAGCGPGLVIAEILKANKGKSISITGLDLSSRMIERARRTCGGPGVELQVADLNRRLEFPAASFDRVVCSNTLYALDDPGSAISEFHRVLKQAGVMAIANPRPDAGETGLIRAHISEISRLTPPRRKLHGIVTSISLIPVHLVVMSINRAIVQKGRSRSYHFLDREDLERICQEAGFKSVSIGSCYADQDWLVKAEK